MEEKQLRVLMVNNTLEENPSYVMRNKIVGQALNKLGHEVFYASKGIPDDIDVDDYDIFVFNRFYEGSLKNEISQLRALGKIIVYETDDDYFSLDSNCPFRKLSKHAKPSSQELMILSDAITVSTKNLKEKINKFVNNRKPIFVIPNSLNFNQYKQRENKKELRIGWQGSHVHIGDLLMIAKPLKKLQKKYKFKLVLFGIDDLTLEEFYKFCLNRKFANEKWSSDMVKLYEIVKTMKYEHYPFTKTYNEYRKTLPRLGLDIGLCPLQDTEFNRAKSCLKYYEYVATGTVALASDVIPYNEEMYPKDLVSNTERTWERRLEKLIVDKEYREGRLRTQKDWLKGYRNIDDVSSIWESVYTILLKNKQ